MSENLFLCDLSLKVKKIMDRMRKISWVFTATPMCGKMCLFCGWKLLYGETGASFFSPKVKEFKFCKGGKRKCQIAVQFRDDRYEEMSTSVSGNGEISVSVHCSCTLEEKTEDNRCYTCKKSDEQVEGRIIFANFSIYCRKQRRENVKVSTHIKKISRHVHYWHII